MAEAVSVTSVAGVPERADVGAIERELHRLWSSLDGDTSGADASTAVHVTRICTLTLVAVVRDAGRVDRATTAARLATRYPSRSLVLHLGAAAAEMPDGRLAAEIALNCHTAGPSRPTVCCEQITVSADGRAVARVPALVLPLLVPDLPVYVWWPGDPPVSRPSTPDGAQQFGAELLRRLAEAADVLIVDSSEMVQRVAGLRTAAALAGRLSGGLRDLTWGRLTPWRDIIAQCFDPPPMQQALERLDRIRIRTASGPETASSAPAEPIAGLMLGGWLASRLGWEPAGPARRDGPVLRALFWRDGGGVELSVEGGGGPVLLFECAAGGSDPCTVSIVRRPDESGGAREGRRSAVEIETRLGRMRPRTTAAGLSVADDATLIGAEFEVPGVDHILREALDLVLRLMEGLP